MLVDLSAYGDPEQPALGGVQRALILKAFGGFAALSGEELALLASICRERHYSAGEVMHEPGKPVVAFHLVIDGDVQMFRRGKPHRVLSGRTTVGALASLARDPQGAHAVAKTDVFTLMMEAEDMDEVFEDNFSIIHGVMVGLGHGLREGQIAAGGGAAVDTDKRIDKVDLSRSFSLVDKMFLLRAATNFAQANIEALAQMAGDAEEVRVAAGDSLWPLGEIAQWSLLLVDGIVECVPENGEPFRFGPSFYVGSLDSVTTSPRWYACRAETDVVGLRIYNNRLLDMLEDHTDMALEMTRNFARGLSAGLERSAEIESASEEQQDAAEAPETPDDPKAAEDPDAAA